MLFRSVSQSRYTEARVKALEERHEVTHRLAAQHESNLDKARRLYPKGTGFKTLGTVAHTIVSSGEFKEEKRGIYDSNTKHYVLLDGQWADIVQDDNGG